MRQRHKPWADDFLQEHPDTVISNPVSYRGRWKDVFANDAPIHLEIGTGKGQFIVEMAKQYPNINFIGIEVAKSIIVTAAQKVLVSEQLNIRLLHVDAERLTELFAKDELTKIYLNFSDPWPKNRHEKRRLTYYTFLDKYKEVLRPNGEIILKTDNMGLFEYSLASFSQNGMRIEEVNLDLHEADDSTNRMTEYEEKFTAKGQPIYRCRITCNHKGNS
ncbi:tRNA (guanine-N(7)-)-methyltransferase [Virgibacillus pantothenticus]|uniref:tRNA (guanosine(46)-N7)-methyltransferase TrmB n=1 Tax=Virgibacillus TaxID=84406 RepID=UPI00090A45B7|nr:MULTISPECIES: tRNA (guanosine(46)-N7)-methyltransferase TrmB [Virgibacillus]API90882.1 tRNA (guanosine(46)-N7)-methyltransferase TrmB [Virgibacillus sp. 6R]MBS7429333.1 tRNA (guanosine(46)-N7)-methyltransferase TrmB [Virgibacillus sp. 19R1-5]MBU8568936.1 tRNA (guanosine(46)-N7)-methyltransferase TrmB [Virgibacillus pantothenticus]MBU8602971.1 tRNA (guanosine(46)-N7)-methyltransferase TrmB [Virgibacillus pantothenticus]MBU8637057.1 tRNA (guanosine(46)-N7)-methyltransferase TrmB [Virgibacillu